MSILNNNIFDNSLSIFFNNYYIEVNKSLMQNIIVNGFYHLRWPSRIFTINKSYRNENFKWTNIQIKTLESNLSYILIKIFKEGDALLSKY
jgi:hypothetical protein